MRDEVVAGHGSKGGHAYLSCQVILLICKYMES